MGREALSMSLAALIYSMLGTYWIRTFITLLVAYLAYNRLGYGLSKIPGPFLASLSDLWLFIYYYRGKGLTEYNVHVKYASPLVRLGPNTVSVSDPEALKVFMDGNQFCVK